MTRDQFLSRWKKDEREEDNSSLSVPKRETFTERYNRKQAERSDMIYNRLTDTLRKGSSALTDVANNWQDSNSLYKNRTEATKAYNEAKELANVFKNDERVQSTFRDYADVYNNFDFNKTKDFYSKYLNADAFNKAKRQNELETKYSGKSYDEIQKAYKSATDPDEKGYLFRYTDYSSADDFQKAIDAEQARINGELATGKFKGGIKSTYLDDLNAKYDSFKSMNAFNEYKDIMNRSDFSKYSDPTKLLNTELGLDENGKATLTPMKERYGGDVMDRGIGSDMYNKVWLSEMPEDMQRVAAYLYETKGADAYKDFINKVSIQASAQTNEEQSKAWSDWTKQNLLTGTVGTLVNTVSRPIEYAGATLEEGAALLTGAEYNPFRGFAGWGREINQSQSELADIVANTFDNDVVSTLARIGYNAATEGVTSRIGQMATGGLYNLVMGGGVLAQTYGDALLSGMSKEQALGKAVAAGAIEAATEQIGMEGAFKWIPEKSWWVNILKQGLAEGSEEVVGNLANAIYDNFANGKNSELQGNVQNYMAQGYTREEAIKMASTKFALETLEEAATAALSAGISGGVQTARTASTGKHIDFAKLGEAITTYNKDSETAKTYQTVLGGYEGAEKVPSWNKGYVFQQAMNDANEQYNRAMEQGDNQGMENALMNRFALENAILTDDQVRANKKANKTTESREETSEAVDGNVTESNKVSEAQKINTEDAVRIAEQAYIDRASKGYNEVEAKLLKDNVNTDNVELYKANFDYVANAAHRQTDLEEVLQHVTPSIMKQSTAIDIYNTIRANDAKMGQIATEANNKTIAKWDNEFSKQGKLNVEVEQKNLTKEDKRFLGLVNVLTHMGMDINVIKDAEKENGWVTNDDNTITLNLAAQYFTDRDPDKGRYVVNTLAHESTHWIENILGKEEFNGFKNLIKSHVGNAKWNEFVGMEIARAKETGDTINLDTAESEATARFCEDMFNDMSVADKLFESASKSQIERIAQAIKDFFTKIRDDIKAWMKGYDSRSEEARFLRSMDAAFAQVQDKWTEMFDRALKVNQVMQSTKEGQNQILDNADIEIGNDGVAYNKKTLGESWLAANNEDEVTEVAKVISDRLELKGKEGLEKAKEYVRNLHTIANIEANNKALQYDDTGLSSWVSNSDYGGNFDFSYLCPKRLVYTGTMTAIREKLNKPMTPTQFLALRRFLINNHYDAPCSYCYVESTRIKLDELIQKNFLNKKENKKYGLTLKDLTNADTLEKLRQEWLTTGKDNGFEAFEKAMNKLSQRKPKALEKRRAYHGEILSSGMFTADKVKEINDNRGLRFFAFSDFEVPHMLDLMQVITDMSVRRLAGFAYTKQANFVKVFGGTGLKINMSTVAKGVGKDGRIVFDDVEGMNSKEAIKLREKYSQDVGIVCVVFTDEQLKAALADNRIDYVLPFHRSQWSKNMYHMMGLPTDTKDFTREQTEKEGDETSRKTEANIPIKDFWVEGLSGRENAQRYLDLCNERGITPIFRSALDYEGGTETLTKKGKHKSYSGGKWVLPKGAVGDGYYKVLIEQKMYDNDGKPAPQRAVMPDFDMKEANTIASSYDADPNVFPVANDVVKDFMKWHKDGEKLLSRKVSDISDETYSEMKEHFGTTTNYNVAGYMLKDGTMLDFSGKHWGGGDSGSREVDHRDIQEVLPPKDNGIGNMIDMIGNGNIRLMPEVGGINLAEMPTSEQMSTLEKYINYHLTHGDKEVTVDFDEPGGDTVKSYRYDSKASSRQILSDIVDYFQGGGQSELMQFHTRYSKKVTDRDLVKKLDNEKHIKVYRTFQVIDGGLYAPMNAEEVDEDTGKYTLGFRSELGQWEMATESIDIAQENFAKGKRARVSRKDAYNYGKEYAKFDLRGGDNRTDNVAYNPYLHASNLMLNDQLSASHRRNLVVVECVVPASEANGEYWAEYAKDNTGWHDWKSGTVASAVAKAKPEYTRKLFLSRYLKPVRIVPAKEVAKEYAKYLDGVDVKVPWNVVTNELRTELEKVGVPINYGAVQLGSGKKTYEEVYGKKYSKRVDSEGRELSEGQQEYFAKSLMRDENGNLKVMYHGSPRAGFTIFSMAEDGISYFFTDDKEIARTYSNTKAVNNPDRPMTFKQLQDAYRGFTGGDGELVKNGDTYSYNEIDEEPIVFNSLKEAQEYLYDNFISYAAAENHTGGSNYANYLNLENPLEIDCWEHEWDELPLDGEITIDEWWDEGFDSRDGEITTREYAKYAHEHGYDGVIFYNIIDSNNTKISNHPSTVAVVFDSNQAKSIYNENPTKDKDIRKSRKVDSEDNNLVGEIKKAITQENFKSLVMETSTGSTYLLTKSTRHGERWQLSYISDTGEPFGHDAFKDDESLISRMSRMGDVHVVSPEESKVFGSTRVTLKEMLDEPRKYRKNDFVRAFRTWDRNADLEGATKDELIDILKEHVEEEPEVGEVAVIIEKVNRKLSRRVKDTTYELLNQNKRLERENDILKKDVASLKELLKLQSQVTEGKILNEKKLNLAAKTLLSEARSTYDREELVNDLKDLYGYILENSSQEGAEIHWDEIMSKAYDIASKVLGEQRPYKWINDSYDSILKEIRSARIKLSDAQIEEAKNVFGDNYRNSLFGRIFTTNDGRSLDSYWSEWSAAFPGVFEEDVNEGDQITRLSEIYDTLNESREVLQYFNTMEDARQFANEIYNKFWTVSTLETVADKNAKEVNRLKFEHRQAMDELKDSYKKALDKIKRRDATIKRVREEREHKLAEYKMYRDWQEAEKKQEAERKAYVDRITDTSATLMEWLTKNDGKNGKSVPDGMKAPVTALLTAIDFSSKRALGMTKGKYSGMMTAKDRQIAEALDNIREYMLKDNDDDNYVDLHENIVQDMKELSQVIKDIVDKGNGFVLNQMSVKELERLNNIMTAVKTSISNINTRIGNQSRGMISEQAIPDIEADEELGQKQNLKLTKGIKSFFEWKNTLPQKAFDHLGIGASNMFQELKDGWSKFAFHVRDIIDYSNNVMKEAKLNYRDLAKNVHEFTTHGGKKIKMNDTQIMSLYCLSKREQALKHIYQGGIKVAEFDINGREIKQTEPVVLTQADIDMMVKELTPQEIKVADAFQEFMNTTCSNWMNEVTMKRWGIKGATEENYFPITVDENTIDDKGETPKEQSKSIFKLLIMGFTKALNDKASNPLVVDDIFEVFKTHASDMAKYNALALPVLDMYRYYNFKQKDENGAVIYNMKQAIETAYGKDAKSYITKFLLDLNANREDSRVGFAWRLAKGYKVAAVAGNLQVMALQPVSILRSKMYLSDKNLLKGIVHIPSGIKEMMENSGIAVWKDLSLFSTDVAAGIDKEIKGDKTTKDKVVDFTMKGAAFMDKITWGAMWSACRAEQYEKGLRGEELMKATAHEFETVVYNTQVVDSTMTRSEVMRGTDPYTQMLTSFLSEPTVTMNMVQDAAIKYAHDVRRYGKAEAFRRNAKNIGKVTYLYVLGAGVEAVLRGVIGKYRDWDEDNDEMLENMWKEFIQNLIPLSNVPLGRDIVSAVQGYNVDRMDMASIQSIVKAGNGLAKVIKGEKDLDYKTIYRSMQAISQITGIPISSLMRDTHVKEIWNATIGEMYPSLYIE